MPQPSFEKNERINKGIETLFTYIKSQPYGTKFTWGELEKYCNIGSVSKERLYYICQRVNDMLIHESMYLDTIAGYGKRILNPSDHTVAARKKVKSAVRVYRKAGTILASTNMDELSDDDKLRVLDEAKKWSTLEHIHSELLRKKAKSIDAKGDANRMVFDLITYLKGE